MEISAIGSELTFVKYCERKQITRVDIPEEMEHTDTKNPGYHFVYEHELLQWTSSLELAPVVLLGSGDYHYINYAVLKEKVDKKSNGYTLLLIDNHSDTEDIRVKKETHPYPINCACHIRESLQKTHVYEMLHFHRKKDNAQVDWYTEELGAKNQKEVLDLDSTSEFTQEFIQQVLDNIFDEVYLSIDIDCLGHKEVDIEQYQAYDQGEMSMEELLLIVRMIKEQKTLLGVDICGMSKDVRADGIYDKLLEVLK